MTDLERAIQEALEASQIVRPNPRAALQREILAATLLITGNEEDVEHDGITYRAQRGEDATTGKVWFYYAEVGDWEHIARFQRVITLPEGYYVSPTGNDASNGSIGEPWRTIMRGISALGPGDTLYIREGTYAEALGGFPSGTSWDAPVIIAAYPGERVVIRPASANRVAYFTSCHHVILDGFVLDGANVGYNVIKITSEAHHIRVQNSEIMGAPESGILVTNHGSVLSDSNEFLNLDVHDNGPGHGIYLESSNNLVDRCLIHHNQGWGVHVYNGSYPNESADNNVVSNNAMYDNARTDNRARGFVLGCGSGNLAYNNLVWGNDHGIQIGFDASDSKVYNNVVYANRGIGVQIRSDSDDAVVRNNIIYQNGGEAISDLGSGTLQDHNLVATDPEFVDASIHDFHLQSTSPAIDAGATLDEVPDDFDRVARPQGAGYDIGAYEFQAAAPTFYVSPDGDDTNDGSEERPWRTITKANLTVGPGDTIRILPGIYDEYVEPQVPGTEDKPIMFQGHGAGAIIAGEPGTQKVAVLPDYTVCENLALTWGHSVMQSWEWVQLRGDGCELRGCTIGRDGEPQGDREFAVAVYGNDCAVDGCRVQGTQFGLVIRTQARRPKIRNCRIGPTWGACINVFDSGGEIRGLLIDSCDVGPSKTGDCVTFQADEGTETLNRGIIIRKNRLREAGENAVDLKGVADILIERNLIYRCIGSNDGPVGGWNNWALQTISCGKARTANRVIVRGNVMFDSCSGVEVQGDDYKIYHNTFVANNRDYTGPDSQAYDGDEPMFSALKRAGDRTGTAFKNNIVADHNSAEVLLQNGADHAYNLFWNARHRPWMTTPDGWPLTLRLENAQTQGFEAHSLEADPQFESLPELGSDPAWSDFELRAESPAQDSAGPLTRTVGTGNADQVEVEDATYFMDGYGVVEGDTVSIAGEQVQIVAISGNVLHLDRIIEYTDGDGIFWAENRGAV
jgi:hypothetical protein